LPLRFAPPDLPGKSGSYKFQQGAMLVDYTACR
jgi:hypothetical protein